MGCSSSRWQYGQREQLARGAVATRRDRHWNEDAARKAMLALFQQLGSDESQQALVREFRTQLARTLN